VSILPTESFSILASFKIWGYEVGRNADQRRVKLSSHSGAHPSQRRLQIIKSFVDVCLEVVDTSRWNPAMA
jgi:hypothetical protein